MRLSEPHYEAPDVSGEDPGTAGRRPRRVAAGILAILAVVLLVAAGIVRNVLGGGARGPQLAPVAAPAERQPTPVAPPIPNVIGRSRSDALAALEASGFSAWVFSAREHANLPVVTSETGPGGTKVTAALRWPDGDGQASSVVLVALGSPKPFPALGAAPTPWWFVHAPTVERERGPSPCFRCHAEKECAECHVRLSHPRPPSGATDPAAVRDAVATVVGERTVAGAVLIRDVSTQGKGAYLIDLNADKNVEGEPLKQANAVTLQLLQGVNLQALRVGELTLKWFLPLDSEPFLVIRVSAVKAGRTSWKRMVATDVPRAVDSYAVDTSRLP